jgi:hypothetical protein
MMAGMPRSLTSFTASTTLSTAVTINAGHGWDLFHYVLSVSDKDGVYEVVKGKPGLSDEPSYVF